MKSIVLFKSKTGFTEKYAKWISKELDCEIFEESDFNVDNLKDYDNIIYGAGLYAGGIKGLKKFKSNIKDCNYKKAVVFATGATPSREETIQELIESNFTKHEQSNIKFFYFRGGFDYNKLKPFDKVLMNIMKFMIKIKKQKTPDEKGMLAAYDNPVDFTREKNIEELINYIKS